MRDSDRDGEESLGSYVKDQVGVDTYRGTFRFFGKEFDVGRSAAPWLKMLVNTGMELVYRRGGSLSRDVAIKGAGNFVSAPMAAKVGTGAEMAFRFGGPLLQTGLEVATTIRSSLKGMNALRDEASVLLAANNNLNISMGNLLTCKYSALCHKRALVYANAKQGIIGSAIGAIAQLPILVRGWYQYQLDRIQNPALAATEAERKKFEVLRSTSDAAPRIAKVRETGDGTGIGDLLRNELNNTNDPLMRHINDNLWVFDGDAWRSLYDPRSRHDYTRNLQNSWAAVPLGGAVAEWLGTRFANKNSDKVVAWDRIKQLEATLQKHKQPDQDRITALVKDVFEQHAKDLGRKYELQGTDYDNAVDALAGALTYGKLPAQALAEVLDNQKIVTFGDKDADFAQISDIKEQLALLQEKYSGKVRDKDFFKDVPFTKETLVKTFNGVPAEERPFFALLFPPGILEKAGVDKKEVKKYLEKGKEYFVDELSDMMRLIVEMGRDKLKKLGVKGKIIDELEALQQGLQRAERSDSGNDFIESNKEAAMEVVRNTVSSMKKPEELWGAFVARKRGGETEKENAQRKPIDHVEGNSSENTSQLDR